MIRRRTAVRGVLLLLSLSSSSLPQLLRFGSAEATGKEACPTPPTRDIDDVVA